MWWLVACTGGADPAPSTGSEVHEVPWSRGLPERGPAPRGWTERRAIVHLHSPWSHDACDGEGLLDGTNDYDGAPNPDCLADLRSGLCDTHVDLAFLTDHPSYSAWQPYDELFMAQAGDERVPNGNLLHCDDGHTVLWMPGVEDELMPVSLDRQVAGEDWAENDRLYNGYDAEAIAADEAAGASVFLAHTEQRATADLEMLQDAGLRGVEVFNLHAMFAPDIREEWLGLDGFSWISDVEPFTGPYGTAEPDLLMLGVLQAQPPSLAHWDELLARGPMTGTAGTDAHQNVLPLPLRDGERGDSYRRMLRWFSNLVWVGGDSADDAQSALVAGRSYVAFEVLGTPAGFDFALTPASGDLVEMGGEGTGGTLHVGCPTLDPASPRGLDEPEIDVHVLKDGVRWHEGCGEVDTDGPGVYRVEVEMVPWHLRPFLGEEPDPWLHAYPWIYGNPIRVR
jgi:hypothetical protein